MSRVYDGIGDERALWIPAQPMFFVATALANLETHIEPNRVAWLDLTGSGVETIAHLKADGGITPIARRAGHDRRGGPPGGELLRLRRAPHGPRRSPRPDPGLSQAQRSQKTSEYRKLKNTQSIDGPPGLPVHEEAKKPDTSSA